MLPRAQKAERKECAIDLRTHRSKGQEQGNQREDERHFLSSFINTREKLQGFLLHVLRSEDYHHTH